MERTLFSEYDLRATMEAHRAHLVDEIKQAPEQHVLQADANSWAESLAARWAMVCAQIDPDALYMDYPEACQVDDSAWPGRDVGYGSPYVEGHRTTVHLPFSGDGDTLRMQPSSYHFGPKPSAEIHGDRLRPTFGAGSIGSIAAAPPATGTAAKAPPWNSRARPGGGWRHGAVDRGGRWRVEFGFDAEPPCCGSRVLDRHRAPTASAPK